MLIERTEAGHGSAAARCRGAVLDTAETAFDMGGGVTLCANFGLGGLNVVRVVGIVGAARRIAGLFKLNELGADLSAGDGTGALGTAGDGKG
jgi:hypothetical protein